jgi:carboxyl-terminal processing protease
MRDALTTGCKFVLIALLGLLIAGTAFAAGFGAGAVLAPLSPALSSEDVELPTLSLEDVDELPISPSDPTPTSSPPDPTPTPTPTVSLEPSEAEAEAFDLFWEVWHILEEEYYGELPDETRMTYGAIRGVLDVLDDDHTVFFDPDMANIMREDMSGSFEGIGAFVRMREDGRLMIVAPMEGQPAEAAGLRAGDIILEADGVPLIGMNVSEAILYVRGPKDSVVQLRVLREGVAEPFIVEVTRARIQMPTVEAEMLDDDVAYVKLYDFNAQANARLKDALEELLAQNPRGLIFDLRNNPGGFLNEAVAVASQFVSEGNILIERFSDGTERVYEAREGGVALDVPLVVLVNAGSASASEIVAGAIQDTNRGTLIGETTFGKGSVQLLHQLRDGSELRVTIARWFTPGDRLIHGQGLEPDIVTELTLEDRDARRDPQLDRAVEYLLTGQ